MSEIEIRNKIKQIIANITNLDAAKIGDDAAFIDDLNLDSLSLLEVGVDIDYEFKLGLPEERMRELRTVNETVALVLARKAEQLGKDSHLALEVA